MSKSKSNNGKSKNPKIPPVSPNTPNNAAPPKTMAETYSHAWSTLFNKLSKEEQELLLINLKKEEIMVRGKAVPYPNVNSFVKNVAIFAEEMFDNLASSSNSQQVSQR